MYCKKCGYKLNEKRKKCSECGNEITEIEYCGGFWGLVEEDATNKSVIDKKNELSHKTKEEKARNNKKSKTTIRILVCLIVILLVFEAVQMIQSVALSNKYNEMMTSYKELKESYEVLELEKDDLERQLMEMDRDDEEIERWE